MTKEEIGFIFGLEPKKAIEFLKAKKVIAGKLNEKEIMNSARAKATSIANLTSLAMTQDIYQSLVTAQEKGQSFHTWKKNLFEHFKKKGWIAGYDGEHLIADPQTAELFGTPRRLETIYRTNMQAAYSAQRYQQMRDNVDNRPYWQYSAVNDERTRPSHSAMHGLIYRYDDPFWNTFYPPNGFNCRCSVTALSERDIKRNNLVVGDSKDRLVKDFERPHENEKKDYTTGFRDSFGRILTADKGFDYNIGRTQYRPDLELYPEKLAHEFAKQEMSGEAFKFAFEELEKEFKPYSKKYAEIKIKSARNEYLRVIRERFKKDYTFIAGILNEKSQKQLGTTLKTIWLSDDSLIKQIANRQNQDFGFNDYTLLPDILYFPEKIELNGDNNFRFYKKINNKRFIAVIKVLNNSKEIYLTSMHLVSEKQWNKAFG